RFGTIGAVFETGPVEITTFRSDSYRPGSRKPDVQFGDSLEADLSRRDFTINAMAQDVLSGRIIDPHGGLADLVAGRIRAVGTADDRFREDPLRVLRCVRFAAQLGFDIEAGTLAAARRTAGELRHVSAERIGAELNLTLLSQEPGRALVTLLEIGVLGLVMPELIPLQQTEQEERRQHKDVFAHTMRVLSNTPEVRETRWAALLHDIGKPQTKSIRNRRIRFFGHEEVGARMARKIMRRLKFDGGLTDRVTHIVRLHMRANAYEPGWTDGAVRRFILEAGEDLDELIALSRADITSYRPRRIEAGLARVAELQARCEHLQAERDVAALDSPLDGHALMELFDRPPGVWIKPIKQYLLDLVLDGELEPDDVEGATVLAKAFVRRHTEAADAIESEAHHAQR
ncbi:MAG: HD domain-containing protein, partial [Chloroflexota bacterium]|nr:HD domain-containing protein [Chloroflexota bacterium]